VLGVGVAGVETVHEASAKVGLADPQGGANIRGE
jgi:hypothetical protein